MATEVLVNDGGAPARILPFTAGSAVTAGRLVTLAGDGKVDHSGVNAHNAIGVALTDAAADGDIMSVVTGKGVILNVAVSGTMDEGKLLKVTANGVLVTGTDATLALSGTSYAVCLELGTGTGVRMVKCLMRN
mgnify:CR=1 FL=1